MLPESQIEFIGQRFAADAPKEPVSADKSPMTPPGKGFLIKRKTINKRSDQKRKTEYIRRSRVLDLGSQKTPQPLLGSPDKRKHANYETECFGPDVGLDENSMVEIFSQEEVSPGLLACEERVCMQ